MLMTAARRQTGNLEEEEEEEDRAEERPTTNGVMQANGDEGVERQKEVYFLFFTHLKNT